MGYIRSSDIRDKTGEFKAHVCDGLGQPLVSDQPSQADRLKLREIPLIANDAALSGTSLGPITSPLARTYREYSECTEAQMMAMFGWRDHKMPALYIAKANRDKLAISGMEKIEAYDQMENIADLAMPSEENRIVTFESNRQKKS